ncbi:MAG: GNAT family N-acetyltransferase [Methylorubrum populi]
MSLSIRRLGAEDAPAYRTLRLEALSRHPEAFGAAYDEEALHPLAWTEERLAGNVVLGGVSGGDGRLVGTAGLSVPAGLKMRHRGVLWGMYVSPQARRTGVGTALVQALVSEANSRVEEVTLTVASGNEPALTLYRRAGFIEYGQDLRALKLEGDRYVDETLMRRRLRR